MNYNREGYSLGQGYAAITSSSVFLARYFASQLRALVQLLHDASNFLLIAWQRPREARRIATTALYYRLFNALTILIVVWVCVLYWGEASLFNRSIATCDWASWEQWPSQASPHHLVFIADPQLIDPHTYPGRPWPLSTLTIKHTDLYLRRSYSRIQQTLDPATIFFLGDLFDGGREWSTATTESPEERYRSYGNIFWIKEFGRFSRIFLREWDKHDGSHDVGLGRRRVIASLPGNHDLGFGKGIQKPVRDRFNAYFGDGNRVDVIGNHTFVSLDTVSLSAKEQDSAKSTRDIWEPADNFLSAIQQKRDKAVERYLQRRVKSTPAISKHEHSVETIYNTTDDEVLNVPVEHRSAPTTSTSLPTILLSHVPLFRKPGTPCGPLRERHPPSPPPPGQTTPVIPDDRNAISVTGGYQYQNVLTEPLTHHIITQLGDKVDHIFSADDHDYCDLVHDYPTSNAGVREITVKSISWAMGVRHPGFVMVSLWNPLSPSGVPLNPSTPTLQTHLCLLPDQLTTFIHYGLLSAISLFILLVRAIYLAFRPPTNSPSPLLPQTRLRSLSSAEREKAFFAAGVAASSLPQYRQAAYEPYPQSTASSSTSASSEDTGLCARGKDVKLARGQWGGRVRGASSAARPNDFNEGMDDDDGLALWETKRKGRRRGRVARVVSEWWWGFWCVGRVAVAWFMLLLLLS